MVKAVVAGKKDLLSKNYFNTPKGGFVQKNKNQKFKQTPMGKVALINGSNARNHGNAKQQNPQKQTNNSPQRGSEKNKEQKRNSQYEKKLKESNKKELENKNAMLDEEEDDSDSEIDEDINEGVVLGDQTMIDDSENSEEEEETDDDEEDNENEQEKNVPDILGTSLADETDEDDDDYEAEEAEEAEDEDKVQVNKGVKMFKGLKQANNSSDSLKDSSDKSTLEGSSVEEEDEDDDGDEDDDDDGDEDDEDLDDEEEVEDEEEEDEEYENEELGEEEEEDDDDDEEEEEDESEDEEDVDDSALGLKALIDNTIVDDDEDDEDFVEPGEHDEDDDISDEEEEEEEEEGHALENSQQNKNTKKDTDTSLEQIKMDKRTVFVGNLPKDVKKTQLKKLFRKFGTIDTIRLRGTISKSLNVPKKVAVKTKDVHPKLKSVYAYIKYMSEECAKAALSLNGTMFEGNYLGVDTADKTETKYDPKKSVFLGNLHFKIDDNTVRKHFEECGEIESVRVIRDNKTGVGKGFGYVNFKTEDAVALALELDGTTILNRQVRVKPNQEQHRNKKGKHGKRSHSSEGEESVAHKKSKNNAEEPVPVHNKQNAVRRIADKEQKSGKKQANTQQEFQGQKVDANKKKRKNKLDKKKKILAEKLTAKPKKPTN